RLLPGLAVGPAVQHGHGRPARHALQVGLRLGPGGYYGRCWNSLFDCLSGGFGAVPPFTLVWHDFEVARRALAGEGMTADSYAEEVVGRLRGFGATVELR
ncbi:barstar family protein, partial [Streptomyces sp. NPDC041003]|uniref:barstar family protein n=1 Tax=Streptomyces sp. NPDC041003 TaxID=3155730 RepID=UPI0033CAA19B